MSRCRLAVRDRANPPPAGEPAPRAYGGPEPAGPIATVRRVDEPPARHRSDDNLILDQLDQTLKLITGNPDEAVERALQEVGIDTRAEAYLMAELGFRTPLAHPERFEDGNRLVMRGLEVLDRDGWKHPKLPALGPLTAVAEPAVEFVARYIVRSYVANVVRQLARLYARRESQSPTDSPERRMLARARIQADRLALGFKGGASGLPPVLVGGAAIPVLAGASRRFGTLGGAASWVFLAGGAVLILLFAALAWVLLQGAGLAHRRSVIALGQPLAALYETIGHCGRPPHDESANLVLAAIILTALAWFVLPVGLGLLFAFL